MGYYIRILSPSDQIPSVGRMNTALVDANLKGKLNIESGTDDDWEQLILTHDDGQEISAIERNISSSGDLVSEEIDEFLDEIADCKPASAAAWLTTYLPTVRTIYAFQILHGANISNGWELVREIQNAIFSEVGGVLQADAEGFTDEEGYHILWQFADSVEGPWWMSVLRDGEWMRFQMDLGNKKHRASFLRGEIPAGVKMI